MVKIKPFQAVRPNNYDVDKIASLPYDVVNVIEAKELVSNNPKSFLRVDRAEVDLSDDVAVDDDRVYEMAKTNYQDFLSKGWLVKEEKPSYYLYRLTRNGKSQYGIVMAISVDDYINNTIKVHEKTRPDKEIDRIRHNDALDANTSPIFLTYKDHSELNDLLLDFKNRKMGIYCFESFYNVEHYVWKIDEDDLVEKITNYFRDDIEALYIADGHHRMAAAAKITKQRREEFPDEPDDAELNYFLGIAFPTSQLEILPYNRLVHLPLKDGDWAKIETYFTVEALDDAQYQPQEKGSFGMYIDKKWYKLTIKDDKRPENYVDGLDASLLQNFLFEPIFGITDPKTDQRLDFIGGIHDKATLMKLADKDASIAFSLYPTSMDELLTVSDLGEQMPPKSTWFEPKLLSGLFLHELETEKGKK
ncbi:hypothetical protein BW721_02035 [Jeotgalibaca sp. PTS2502]|uniref:DUF1015 domain-containing protein n=1 Tax=Jeotgalibaca sp. PTS2502 TaxID=1903686 RepID=UPI000973B0E0|nr:DUF1015 family protein [Jeotgalibaca sp. PTS2502]APZ48562.1 hypothetical protein BW721_02035 [Jeotgalibaca sp. PTS2502]